MREEKGKLVLEEANGLGRGTSTEVCKGLGMPVVEPEAEELIDLNGKPSAVPERARAKVREATEVFIADERM